MTKKANKKPLFRLKKNQNNRSVEKTIGPWKEMWYRLKKNKFAVAGLVTIVILILIAIFADYVAPFSFRQQDLNNTFQTPNSVHWFGTDNFGRDIFSRVVYGARVSLRVGIISVSIALIIGGTLGAIAGYKGGLFDSLVMRMMDILLAVPQMLLAIAIVSAMGGGLNNVMIAVGISSIPQYARIVRANVLSLKEQQFIEAARAVGSRNSSIVIRHIIPNTLAPLIVQSTLGVAGAILAAAGLGFLGLGLEPPRPEWGAMLNDGRHYLRDYPHMTTFPGLAIMITILSLNLLGDGLRDALDPKLKH
jgi:peptide/nickel transport system permease protein